MSMRSYEIKIRTASELSAIIKGIGVLLLLSSCVALFFAKNFGAAILILLAPLAYLLTVLVIVKTRRSALMNNSIDSTGIKNSFLGKTFCELEWKEIGDFGVAEVKKGFLRGQYIFLSRVFVKQAVRLDLIKRYDPRICIVIPYNREVCEAISNCSNGKIEIK